MVIRSSAMVHFVPGLYKVWLPWFLTSLF